jgi:23S rRNA (cytosine1962-C5)-methyltransferase
MTAIFAEYGQMTKQPTLATHLYPEGWTDYRLLDSGQGLKLEQFGPYRFIRPEPQALWAKFLTETEWASADGRFLAGGKEDRGKWQLLDKLPASWQMSFEGITFTAQPTPFRHLGFFPEQSPHWQWAAEKIRAFNAKTNRSPKLLNLFAYSGVASLHAAAAGAEVTHLDASKRAVAQAFNNRTLSGLENAPIRFITDDVLHFVAREQRRGKKYDGILLDPPKYGRGPKGEVWQINENLPELLAGCRALLSDEPLLMIATLYAIRTSTTSVHAAIADALDGLGGHINSGELALREDRPDGRAIGQALYVRWSS